jgi:hypothetical protein
MNSAYSRNGTQSFQFGIGVFTVCRTFFQRRRHKDGRRRKVYMIRYAICSLWEVDDTGRAMESGPQATGETDYQPLPHKEQKMDRTCKRFYTACRSGRRRPFLLAPWPAREHQNLHEESSCSAWLMMILIIDRKRMTLLCGD